MTVLRLHSPKVSGNEFHSVIVRGKKEAVGIKL